MKKYLLSVLLVLLTSLSVFSKENYKEGLVLTNSNDTLMGFIDLRKDSINGTCCYFMPMDKDTLIVYFPNEIKAYWFPYNGKRYESKSIRIGSETKAYFLEFLVEGMVDLYYLRHSNGKDYYFMQKEKESMVPMTKERDNYFGGQTWTDEDYKKVMKFVFRDCPALASGSFEASFDRQTMIYYAKTYHSKMSTDKKKCVVYEDFYQKIHVYFDWSLYTGVELNTLTIPKEYFSRLRSLSPIIGGGVEIWDPLFSRNLRVALDLNLSQVSGACDYAFNDNSYAVYSYSGIKSALSLGLKFRLDNLYHPFVQLDYTQRNLSGVESKHRFDHLKADGRFETYAIDNKIYPNFKRDGITAGLGFDYPVGEKSNLIFKLSYELSLGDKMQDQYNTYQFRMGYKF